MREHFLLLIILLTGMLFFPVSLRADRLDDLTRLIDRIEYGYWDALARSSGDPLRDNIQSAMHRAHALALEIQDIMRKKRMKSDRGNLVEAISNIRDLYQDTFSFGNTKKRKEYCRRLNSSKQLTTMYSYREEFQKQQREIARYKQQQLEKQNPGKKTPKVFQEINPNSRNVSLDAYDHWLERRLQHNSDAVSNFVSRPNRRQVEKFQSYVTSYCDSIRVIRIVTVELRQKYKKFVF